MAFSFLALSVYAALVGSVLGLPIQHELETRANVSPIMGGQNFPDPGIIKTDKGWYAFSTNALVNGKRVYMQKAFTSDFKNWQFTPGDDAFPNLPSWIDSNARVVSISSSYLLMRINSLTSYSGLLIQCSWMTDHLSCTIQLP